MAHRLPALTAHDRTIVRRAARELREGYEQGDDDSTSEIVMLSSGYADVHIGHDSEADYAFVVRHGRTTRVPMSAGPRSLTAKDRRGIDGDRAWGTKMIAKRKTGTRKKVPSRKVANPSKRKRAARKTARRPKAKRKANGQFAKKAGRR